MLPWASRRPHPHINLATLTYLFEGQIHHRDSLGTDLAIEPGAVNLMKAGRGIVHSERTAPERRETGRRLFGLQTWMALPEAEEESDPAFLHYSKTDLPTVEAEGMTARLIAGSTFGVTLPLNTASDTLYADVILAPGAKAPILANTEERPSIPSAVGSRLRGIPLSRGNCWSYAPAMRSP